ncbi:MAG: hypothetical protein ACTS9Y_01135 [Methylophilus sp.]|uniref:hypothetical protein n=1 Tax=Methylophilus sp. TaxID=29541 RepID=UPI003FA18988
MKSTVRLSNTLLQLLHFAKNNDFADWRQLQILLAPLYNFELQHFHVLKITFKAFAEALQHDENFCMGLPDTLFQELLLSPIHGTTSIEFTGPQTIEKQYSVEEFYHSQLRYIINCLHISVIDGSDQYQAFKHASLIEAV